MKTILIIDLVVLKHFSHSNNESFKSSLCLEVISRPNLIKSVHPRLVQKLQAHGARTLEHRPDFRLQSAHSTLVGLLHKFLWNLWYTTDRLLLLPRLFECRLNSLGCSHTISLPLERFIGFLVQCTPLHRFINLFCDFVHHPVISAGVSNSHLLLVFEGHATMIVTCMATQCPAVRECTLTMAATENILFLTLFSFFRNICGKALNFVPNLYIRLLCR